MIRLTTGSDRTLRHNPNRLRRWWLTPQRRAKNPNQRWPRILWDLRTDAHMTTDPDEAVERDDLAPTKRLHIIAELLAEGVRRQRDDLRRMGEIGQHPEREADGLEPFEPVRLDRPPPHKVG